MSKGARAVPEMPCRALWVWAGNRGWGQIEILRGELSARFWKIALIVAAKILENPKALAIESVEDLEHREQELQAMLSDEERAAGLKVIIRPMVQFTLKYARRITGLDLREADVAAMVEEFASVRMKATEFKGLRLKAGWERFTADPTRAKRSESGDLASVVSNRRVQKRKRGRPRKEDQTTFTLAFYSKVGLAFYHSLCTGGATMLRGVTKLLRSSDAYQRLIFTLCTSAQQAIIHQDRLIKLVGWRKATTPDMYSHQLAELRRLLNKAISEGRLQTWSELKNGNWVIRKYGQFDLPEPSE
jgi:hypothetical protein